MARLGCRPRRDAPASKRRRCATRSPRRAPEHVMLDEAREALAVAEARRGSAEMRLERPRCASRRAEARAAGAEAGLRAIDSTRTWRLRARLLRLAPLQRPGPRHRPGPGPLRPGSTLPKRLVNILLPMSADSDKGSAEELSRTIAPLVGPDDERVFTDSGIEIDRLYERGRRRPRPARSASASRASRPSPAASTRACTATGSGRCASTPASPPPRTPTSATAT